MGNKLGRRRQVVDERYTRPQGLYAHKEVDHKKLRKLILESKLAPCYPGEEELCDDHEECPICFLYYPSLNRSRCCTKGICTECFLRMKDPNSVQPTCPFCKTANYAVEYRGAKTKEEKDLEQIEEQRVIEAKMRMRRQELQDEEERMQRRLESGASSSKIALAKVEDDSVTAPPRTSPVEGGDLESSSSRRVIRCPTHGRTNRDNEFDLDLEDIMIMEAIWLSVQENERLKNPIYVNAGSSRHALEGQCSSSRAMAPSVGSTSSPSGGLACAIAALAERQQMSGEPSAEDTRMGLMMSDDAESGTDSDSHVAVARTSYASSIITEDSDDISVLLPPPPPPPPPSHAAVARTRYASSIITEDSDDISVLLPPPPPLPSHAAVARTRYASCIINEDSDDISVLLPPPPPPPLLSHAAVARTRYASSIITEDSDDISVLLPPPPPPLPLEFIGGSYLRISGEIMPEVFEEQMMFFKAVPEGLDDVEWASDGAEARTSCASFVTVEDSGNISASLQPPPPPLPPSPPPLGAGGSFTNVSGPIAPENFEGQMMLAMTFSC